VLSREKKERERERKKEKYGDVGRRERIVVSTT